MKRTLDWSFEMGGLFRSRGLLLLIIDGGDGEAVAMMTAYVLRTGAQPQIVCGVTGQPVRRPVFAWCKAEGPTLADLARYQVERANPRRLNPAPASPARDEREPRP